VVDNVVNGRRENLAGMGDAIQAKVTLAVADIRDAGKLAELLRDADIVCYLACLGVR
jgi:nucleoside-diphosphate-sugar epimerase